MQTYLHSPFGKLSPGTAPLDIIFKNAWREAEKNREKYGCKSTVANPLNPLTKGRPWEDGNLSGYLRQRRDDYSMDHVLEGLERAPCLCALRRSYAGQQFLERREAPSRGNNA
jgi:hypothetical protein